MNRYEFYKKLDEARGTTSETFLCHYGIIGQKWGQRRWQNADGTFNEEGKIRYFGSKKATQNLTNEEIGSLYSAGQKIKNLFPQKRIGENGEEYDARYQNHYGYLTEKGKKYLERHPHDATGKLNMKLYAESLRRGAENDAEREKERLAREAKQKSDIEYINNLKSNIKTTKELKGEEISDKEFKDIIRELDNFDMRDFERNHKEDYNKVADIGIDALNKAEGGWVEDDIRDDGNREWFMWEDQTIGNPEIAYLYYKGYSKDYIKQYLDKYVPYEDKEKYSDDEYSKGFFVKDEFHRGGDAYIDALFDKGEEDQKIGGFISDVKINKKVKQLNKEIEKLENDPIGQKRLFEEYLNDVGKGGYDQLNEYLHQDKNYKFIEQDVEKYYKSIEKNTRTQKFEDASAKAGIIKALSETDNMIEIASELDKYVNNYKENSINDDITAIRLYDSGYNDYSINAAINLFDVNAKRLRKATDEYLSKDNKSYDKLSENSKSKLFERSTGGIAVNNGRNTIRKYLEEANRSDMQDNYKKYSSRANKIMDKLKPSCERKDHNEPNGWYYVWEAINNLGYDNVSYDELSQADWNKINAEINKLKK